MLQSRHLVLAIVALALLLDNMLLTSVVPIVPSFLYQISHPNATGINTGANQSEATRKASIHEELLKENTDVSLLFVTKPLVQGAINPFIGPISNRIGYPIILFMGFIILFVTSLVFAVGNSYGVLVLARAVQGIGSSCTGVAGMGILAETYTDDEERGNAMALALGGLALGVLIGPVYGGTLYEFVGKPTPFLILAALALVDGVMQVVVLHPLQWKKKSPQSSGPSIVALLKDPYILIAAGAIAFSTIGVAVLEPSLPLWMMDTMGATKWQQGMAFLPTSISYLVSTNLFGPLGGWMGRWLAAMIGLLAIGVCLICVPLAKSTTGLIPANAGIGFAIGMVDSSMMPMLGYLVDIRYESVYGTVYAIGDIAFCFAYIVGPIFSGLIVPKFGFAGTVMAVASMSILYAPLLLFLRGDLRGKPSRAELTESEGDEEVKISLSDGELHKLLINEEKSENPPVTRLSKSNSKINRKKKLLRHQEQ